MLNTGVILNIRYFVDDLNINKKWAVGIAFVKCKRDMLEDNDTWLDKSDEYEYITASGEEEMFEPTSLSHRVHLYKVNDDDIDGSFEKYLMLMYMQDEAGDDGDDDDESYTGDDGEEEEDDESDEDDDDYITSDDDEPTNDQEENDEVMESKSMDDSDDEQVILIDDSDDEDSDEDSDEDDDDDTKHMESKYEDEGPSAMELDRITRLSDMREQVIGDAMVYFYRF